MKNLKLILLLTLVITCTGQESRRENIVADYPFLMGKWTGEGGFLNTDLNKDFGPVIFEIVINGDNTISGRVCDAKLTQTSIEKANYGFEIKGILDSKLKKDKDLERKHLIILLVIPKENSNDVKTSDANFHLKNNYFFDIAMRVGGVMLTKQ